MSRSSLPPVDLSGEGMVSCRLLVRSRDVAFLKGVIDAHEGLAQLVAERGGDVVLVATAGRERELYALVADLARELGGIAPPPEGSE